MSVMLMSNKEFARLDVLLGLEAKAHPGRRCLRPARTR
jgi:hypothetical protein